MWYGERKRRIIWQSIEYISLVLKRHMGLKFGDNIWCVVDGIMDVNERSWTAF